MSNDKNSKLGNLSNSQLHKHVEKFSQGQESGAFTREQETKIRTDVLREANERFMAENPPKRR